VGGSDDSYYPNDTDVDVPGAPTLFVRGGQRVVSYGSKNGSFYLLDANTMQVLGGGSQRRQLLARAGGSGHPGNRGTAISSVATQGGVEENKWGVMATPAIHTGLGKIFVGLGGYLGARGGTTTPFIRALDWNTLNDAWPTALAPGNVTKYTLAQPPVYDNANEAALSSPAVVNDVVFVSTTDPANSRMRLYALDAATGLCLWASPIIARGSGQYALGPAISGEYVVAGAGNSVYIYTRPGTPWCLRLQWPLRWESVRLAIEWP
jgi:outer membrane protein assembly factor BamB